jgi:hypothetical protein
MGGTYEVNRADVVCGSPANSPVHQS